VGNYKGINQKGLAFHAEAKQKNYKEEKKLRKPYETLIFLFEDCLFIGSSTTRILGKYFDLDLVNSFHFREFLYFAKDLLPNMFLRYCILYFDCFHMFIFDPSEGSLLWWLTKAYLRRDPLEGKDPDGGQSSLPSHHTLC